MRPLTAPPFLVLQTATLPEQISACATQKGLAQAVTERIVDLLPQNLRNAPCFLDRMTKLWRYEFGKPFDGLPDGSTVFGTHMYPPIEILFDVLLSASRRLPEEQLLSYLRKIDNPEKHGDFLSEFAPIVRLPDDTLTKYEVNEYSIGDSTIDWLITKESTTPLLLEVKNRTRDLLDSFVQIEKDGCAEERYAPPPVHNVSLLFRSIENKFQPSSPEELLQGAWIKTDIKQEESELRAAFETLDSAKVHFTVLGDFRDDVFFLSKDNKVRNIALAVLNCRESNRFVFSRNAT